MPSDRREFDKGREKNHEKMGILAGTRLAVSTPMNLTRPFLTPVLLTSALTVAACATTVAPVDTTSDPLAYYKTKASSSLGAAGNEATCATCHSIDGTQVGFSGNTLKDIAFHTSFKGGSAKTLLDGANACVAGWMGGKALVATDARWVALKTTLESVSSKSQTAPNVVAPEVLENEAEYETAYAAGDAKAGVAKYTQSCASCHASGLNVGGRTAPTSLKSYSIGRIAQQVRTSGPPPSGKADKTDTTPGPMPFFEVKDLAVQDLKDIIAFIKNGA
jgi:mono/diheme cytochrome c family protein